MIGLLLYRCSSKFLFLRSIATNQLDCTDVNLLENVIQSALRRGNNALQNAPSDVKSTSFETAASASLCHSSSSSGDYSSSNKLWKPQQMIRQVGGVSSNKSPVLTLGPHFIMKPMRLSHLLHVHNNSLRDGVADKTKIFRGVREIAFYETLACISKLDEKWITSKWDVIRCMSFCYKYEPSFPESHSQYKCIRLLVRIIKGLFKSADALNRLAFLVAHHAGDEVALSAFKSCVAVATIMESLRKMAAFTPDYYGLVDLRSINADEDSPLTPASLSLPHLLLGDIAVNYRHPNIIDLKMGTQTYEPSAPEQKKRREVQKYIKQEEFGVRIVGMRYYDESSSDYICKGKNFGTGLMTKNQVIDTLRMFLRFDGDHSSNADASRVDCILRQLADIKNWFENSNSNIAFYAGSILIVCEGATASLDDTLPPVVKMIDFAHVCRKKGGDEGYLKGINTLLTMLHEIRSAIP